MRVNVTVKASLDWDALLNIKDIQLKELEKQLLLR